MLFHAGSDLRHVDGQLAHRRFELVHRVSHLFTLTSRLLGLHPRPLGDYTPMRGSIGVFGSMASAPENALSTIRHGQSGNDR